MMTVFQFFEIFAHAFWRPRRIAVGIGDSLPVRVLGIDDDHGIVCCAATKRPGSRIQNAINGITLVILVVLGVPLLLLGVLIMPNEEVPLESFILRSVGMKGRDLIIVVQSILIRMKLVAAGQGRRIAASLEYQDGVA